MKRFKADFYQISIATVERVHLLCISSNLNLFYYGERKPRLIHLSPMHPFSTP